jgi:hypothetical protein
MKDRHLIIALAAAGALAAARSAVYLLWEQAGFDSDQAIFGLMAKHLAEGRAFPMFIYGDHYLLAVQAWLAAPLFALFGPSVALLKLPVVAINMATAMLLVWVLHRDGGLRPGMALIASLFFVLAAPVMAKLLVETGGGNPEPFLYVLLLWLLRDRPLAFGALFAFGFIHREFTAYGVTAIVAISILADRRVNSERMKAVALASIGYLAVAQLVRTMYAFSTPFGPGTTIDVALAANASSLTSRYCWAPETIPPAIARLFGQYLGLPFGASEHRLVDFGVRSVLPMNPSGVPPFWPILGGLLAVALARVAWISVRERRPPWRGHAAVATCLLLIGLQSGIAYAVARCGRLEGDTLRYALLMLYVGVGVVALYFIYEPRQMWRRAMIAVMVAWAAISAVGHGRLLDEYINREPTGPHRALAAYLVAHDIRYARSDYWTAYITTFFADEQVVIASTDTVRIAGYQHAVAAHDDQAVNVQRQPCAGPGAEAVAGTFWVCRRPPQRADSTRREPRRAK